MHAQLDDLLTATYVLVDDFLPKRRDPGRPPRITDAELITLAIAQVFMGLPNDRQFLALAGYRLSHLFVYLPRQSGYNKRLRALTPQIERAINYLAFCSPGWCDQLRLLDSTPVPCAASRETVRRAEFEGWMADLGAEFLRPDRKDEPLQFGSLGRVRQWIESGFWTCKGQLGLERHGARTLPGLCARVGLRLLALAAGLRHNAEIGQPGRCFSAYGH